MVGSMFELGIGNTLVCIDSVCAQHPEAAGLGVDSFEALPFVRIACTGDEARALLAGDDEMKRAFVISSEDVSPLNIAAALKRDRADCIVALVVDERNEAVGERARLAGVDQVITPAQFARELFRPLMTCTVASVEARNEPHAEESHEWESDPFADLYFDIEDAPLSLGSLGGFIGEEQKCAEPLVPMVAESAVERGSGRAFVATFISASGGVGKSTLSYLCAARAAHFGYKTLLIDFDAQFGDLAGFCATESCLHVDELLADRSRVEELAEATADGFSLLAAASLPERSEQVFLQMSEILGMVSNEFRVIMINTGGTWTEQLIALLEQSSKVFFVVDQRPLSLSAAKRAFDLCLRCGLAAGPFSFVLNRCSRSAHLSSIDVSCSLKGVRCFEIADGGDEVGELMLAQHTSDLVEQGNEIIDSLDAMLMDVLPDCAVLKNLESLRPAKFSLFRFSRKRGA